MPSKPRREDYTIGWISALPIELAAARKILDEEHASLDSRSGDDNIYTFGRIAAHNVVLACLPAGQTGTNSAASMAMQMKSAFPCLRFGLMVGIGGGVPSAENDIRLGDVVVGQPTNTHGGVVQYDFGKSTPDGFKRTGFLNSPPTVLLNAVSSLRAMHLVGGGTTWTCIEELEKQEQFARENAGHDVLYEATYDHPEPGPCSSCDPCRRIARAPRQSSKVQIHYGTIASGNQVMRIATERDRISKELGNVLCFEMEAAGLANTFPCLVIRGICDYADSHKNKTWQPFAAATAAAYAKDLLFAIPVEQVSVPGQPGRIVSLPFLKNRNFVGRDAVLQKLDRRLFIEKDCQDIAIRGLGGIGKTQIALAFARSVAERNDRISIFWIAALSKATIDKSFREIAGLLGITLPDGDKEDIKDIVKRHLERPEAGSWLLVIDNLDDNDMVDELWDHLPQNDKGLRLFTSRNFDVVQAVVGNEEIVVDAMEPDEGLILLERLLPSRNVMQKDSASTMLLLLERLEFLPLAIIQAAAYINRNKISPSKYLKLLDSTDEATIRIMSAEIRDRTRYAHAQVGNAVATTWTVSFEQIVQNDPDAARLLKFISCIEWRAIPFSILPQAQDEEEHDQVLTAVGTLHSYSFLELRADGVTYDMHRLVHLATQIWIKQEQEQAQVLEDALWHLSGIFPTDEWKNRFIWLEYIPHATRLLHNSTTDESWARALLCDYLGSCLVQDGNATEAVFWRRECRRYTDKLPDEDQFRLDSLHNLASAMRADGQIEEALDIFEAVVNVKQRTLGTNHPALVVSQKQLASTYRANRQYQKAVLLLEPIVASMKQKLASDDSSLLSLQFELATLYSHVGQFYGSISLLEHVVRIQQRALDADDPKQLASQNSLAQAYLADGQMEACVLLLEHVVEVQGKGLAETHPSLLTSQCELARAYLEWSGTSGKQDLLKSIRLLEHVVRLQNSLREDHPGRLSSKHLLARAYKLNNQLSEAVSLYEHVVDIERSVLREDHPDRLASEFGLADAYLEDRQPANVTKAVSLLQHIVAMERRALREDDPERLESQDLLAKAYLKEGGRDNVAKAIELREHVLHAKAGTLSEEDISRLMPEYNLASAYLKSMEADHVTKAAQLLEHVVEMTTKTLLEDDPRRLDSQVLLAKAYLKEGGQNHIAKAAQLREQVLRIESRTLPEENRGRLTSEYNLAFTYLDSMQPDHVSNAILLLEHIVEVEARTLDEDDPDREGSQDLLQDAYDARRKLQEQGLVQKPSQCDGKGGTDGYRDFIARLIRAPRIRLPFLEDKPPSEERSDHDHHKSNTQRLDRLTLERRESASDQDGQDRERPRCRVETSSRVEDVEF